MILFKVGNTDYTRFIINKSFSVDKNEEDRKRTDGTHHDRYTFLRYRVTGSFTLLFQTKAQYDAWVSAMQSVFSQTERAYSLQVRCNNTGELMSISAKCEWHAVPVQTQNRQIYYDAFELTIEER